jgi:amino acid transporter
MMLSPAALVLHGQLAGLNGKWFVLLYLLAVGIYLISSHFAHGAKSRADDEILLLAGAFGTFFGTWILLLARPAAAAGLAASVLVTAGFVFNETIVYWFPNFAFAAILLLLVMGVNLAGAKAAAAAQVGFTTVAFGGLAVLLIIGGFQWPNVVPPDVLYNHGKNSSVLVLSGIWPVALVFIGYEMVRYASRKHSSEAFALPLRSGILIVALLFVLWNIWSLAFVSPSRLAYSTIPHVLTAKAIAGPTGRYLIATVGIFGSCALVNMLFHTISGMTARMAANGLLPRFWSSGQGRPSIPALVMLGGVVVVMMTSGFAGSERLDLLIRATMTLWIVFYAAIHLSHVVHLSRQQWMRGEFQWGRPWLHVIGTVVMLMVAVGLILGHDRSLEMLKMIVLIIALSALGAWIGLRWPTAGRNATDRVLR